MSLPDPYAWVSAPARRAAFGVATALTLAVMAGLGVLGAPLANEAAPQGILSFEFAGDAETAARIVASWDAQERVRAALNTGLDYLFMPAYAVSIGLACVLLAGAGVAPRLGVALAWGLLLAAAFDAVENLALIRLLMQDPDPLWPALAAACAAPKFALVAAGLLYAAAGGAARLLRHLRGDRA